MDVFFFLVEDEVDTCRAKASCFFMECIFCDAYLVAASLVVDFCVRGFTLCTEAFEVRGAALRLDTFCFRGTALFCEARDVLVLVLESTLEVLLVAMIWLLSFIKPSYYVTFM